MVTADRSRTYRRKKTRRKARRKGARKRRKFPAEPLEPPEIQALLRACSRRAPTGIRNRALLVLLYRTGVRISEALHLYPKDISPELGTVSVLHGKGDKRRTVGMDEESFAMLDHWRRMRRQLGLGAAAPFFCTLRGGGLRTNYIRALLPRLGRRAGITKRVHAHGFRHTHAAELVAEHIPLNVIQAQLGHSNVATTSRYLQHIAPAQVIEAIRQRTWTRKSKPS